jgi:hypothetical protein
MHTRISEAVTDLTGLIARLEEEIPEKRKQPYGGYGSGKGGHGPLAAWNSPAAMLLLEIHAGIRDLETDLIYQIAGVIRTRPGSDGNTLAALNGLPALTAGVPYESARQAARRLESWAYRASLILGDVDPFSRLPRLPGETDPACPYCHVRGSLRVRHATGTVMCLRPGCKDSEGNRPRGRIEVGSFSKEPLIAWADGTTGVGVAG